MAYSSLREQGIIILYSLLFGVGIGIIYEFFRFLRVFFTFSAQKRTNKHIFLKNIGIFFQIILDLLFSIVYTILVVIFIYGANDGKIRYYLLLFAVIGFALYYFTVGRLISAAENFLASLVYKVLSALFRLIKKPFDCAARKSASRRAKRYFKRQFIHPAKE